MMLKGKNKIVGYFAYTVSGILSAKKNACILCGSQQIMRDYINEVDNHIRKNPYTIRASTFGAIMDGLIQREAYAFDETSYNRFLPLVQRNGVTRLPSNAFFLSSSPTGKHFVIIKHLTLKKQVMYNDSHQQHRT